MNARLVSTAALLTAALVMTASCKSKTTVTNIDASIVDATPDAPPDAAPDAAYAPLLRNPVALPDDELGLKALQIIGANVPGRRSESCDSCHSVARQKLRYWRTMSDDAVANCIKDPMLLTQASALATIDCVRADPADPTSQFRHDHLGIYTAAASSKWFEFAFWRAYNDGTTSWQDKFAEWKTEVTMPKQGKITALPLLTQEDFDIVAEYFARGLPMLDEILPTEQTGPDTCTPGISADVATVMNDVALTGWRQIHKDNQLSMLGCQGQTDPLMCLGTYPLATDNVANANWDIAGLGAMRVLKELNYRTSYWTRGSADGRFFGTGGGAGSAGSVVDLQVGNVIPVAAPYDPGFFPDNQAWMFQTTAAGGPRVCSQSLLTANSLANPVSINFSEPECGATNAGLYQHVGRATETGGDYFIVSGCWQGDPANGVQRNDPLTTRDQRCELEFDPLVFNGTTFVEGTPTVIPTPFEGDTVISPSSKLVVSRVAGPSGSQLGYVLRKVNKTATANGYTITAPEIARYCVAGAKPAFSYDDRWLIYHHYIGNADAVSLGFTGADDPGFTPYKTKGASNIYVVDLRTGVRTRITNMQPGQYALFPHFRADGWIYMLVKDRNRNVESIIASPAGLMLEQ
ncbi:MAG: hypothetical protein KBG15_07110 [Kofleriaceae bacterium]|nr:hypothetical protein [Kofleriaceae bacterium]